MLGGVLRRYACALLPFLLPFGYLMPATFGTEPRKPCVHFDHPSPADGARPTMGHKALQSPTFA